MVVKKVPENAENVLDYSVRNNTITLNDEISLNLQKKERDDDVHIDVCFDYLGGLVCTVGADTNTYAAQIDIPARKYEEVEEENPNYDPNQDEGGMNQKTITKKVAVPFSMDNVTLTLWEVEEV